MTRPKAFGGMTFGGLTPEERDRYAKWEAIDERRAARAARAQYADADESAHWASVGRIEDALSAARLPGLVPDATSWLPRAEIVAACQALLTDDDTPLTTRDVLAAIREWAEDRDPDVERADDDPDPYPSGWTPREAGRQGVRGFFGWLREDAPTAFTQPRRPPRKPGRPRTAERFDPAADATILTDTGFLGRQVALDAEGFLSRADVSALAEVWSLHAGHVMPPARLYAALVTFPDVRAGAVRTRGGRGFHGLSRA